MSKSDRREAVVAAIQFAVDRLRGHASAIGNAAEGDKDLDVYRLFLLAANVIRIGNGLVAATAKYAVDEGSERLPTDHIPEVPEVSLSDHKVGGSGLRPYARSDDDRVTMSVELWEELREGYGQAGNTIEEMKTAVKEFLDKRGHDLCPENRRKLAEAFGLPDPGNPDKSGVSFEEFCEGCADYQQQLYGMSYRGQLIDCIVANLRRLEKEKCGVENPGMGWTQQGKADALWAVVSGMGIAQEVGDALLPSIPYEQIVRLLPLSVATAQRLSVCRLCGKRTGPDGKGNPLVLDYGREYAHGYCLEQLRKRGVEPGVPAKPTNADLHNDNE